MDGYSNRDLLVDAVTNNTYDINKVHDTLTDIVSKSYHNLLFDQLNGVGLHRFNFLNSDLLLENNKLKLIVSKELIEQYFRRFYKTSEFYNKEISLNDIINNKKIFLKLPLVYIDGLITLNYTIKVFNDKTEILFDFNKSLVNGYHTFTVMFIYNEDLSITKLNKFIVSKYDNKIPKNIINNLPKEKNNCKMLCFVEDLSCLQGSTALDINITNTTVDIISNDYANKIIDESHEFNIIIFNVRYYHKIDTVRKVKTRMSNNENSIELTVIDNHNMPIPIENIIVYKYNAGVNDYLINNDCVVERHYPYIYKIIDPNMSDDDKYKLGYFYYESLDDISYTNLLYPYFKLIKTKFGAGDMDTAINNAYFSDTSEYYLSLFEKYFSFDDHVYYYNMKDYNNILRPNHVDYRIKKMKDFIKADINNLETYVNNQNDCGTTFYAFMQNIDLSARLRTDTSNEESTPIKLSKPCYLFKFNRETNGFDKLRFFVDGVHIIPDYYVASGDFDYIYINKDMIKDNSFIEIEKFENYRFSKDVELHGTTISEEICLSDYSTVNFKPTLKDIYFISTETGDIISNNDIEILADIDNSIAPINLHEYTFLDKFYIRLKKNTTGPVKITVKIGKINELIYDWFTSSTVCTATISSSFKQIQNYLRVFYNGRLLPYEYWKIVNSGDNNKPYIITKFIPNEKSQIIFDLTPYHYDLIYSKKEINNKEILDLSGVIDKPFNLLYHDIYLNGRKLSVMNVIVLSPTKLQLMNVDSKWNLQIYKKDRDIEYFTQDVMMTIMDELLDDPILPNDDKKMLVDIKIEDDRPDGVNPENTDDENDFVDIELTDDTEFDLLTFLNNEFYHVSHINPDELQFNSSKIKSYDYVYSHMISDNTSLDNNVIRLNPDDAFTATKVIKISSDILKEGE